MQKKTRISYVNSTTFKLAPLRSTGYFLGTCCFGYRRRVEYPVPLLTLLRVQTYLVPFVSARVFIIPKLQNIYWRKSISELFFLYIEHLPNCYFVRSYSDSDFFLNPDLTFREHLSRALPTEKIFYLLRSIRSECLLREYSAELMFDTLEIIVKWLQVSVCICTPQTKNPICV